MDLQSLFYIISILFMLIVLGAVVSIALALNTMKNNVIGIRHDINRKIDEFKEKATPQVSAGISAVATTILTAGLRKLFKR